MCDVTIGRHTHAIGIMALAGPKVLCIGATFVCSRRSPTYVPRWHNNDPFEVAGCSTAFRVAVRPAPAALARCLWVEAVVVVPPSVACHLKVPVVLVVMWRAG